MNVIGDPIYSNRPRDLWKERLTSDEYRIVVEALSHTLPESDLAERRAIMKREMRIDIRWGFFNNSLWASIKRTVYVLLVHRRYFKGIKHYYPSTPGM